jgi:L-asparagine transporter-like permease
MKRPILAFAAALVLWVVVISVLFRGLRIFVTGYAAAEPTFSFTLGMLSLRLVIAALTSLIAGAVAAWIAPSSPRVPVLVGATLLAAFIPLHVRVFSLFPFWYHLVFLVTLIPLVMLGARLAPVPCRSRSPRGWHTHVS